MPEPPKLDQTDHAERDAASLRILGFFFTVLGLLVLVGTYWTPRDENMRATIVNAVSGGVLTAIGAGTLYISRRKKPTDDNS